MKPKLIKTCSFCKKGMHGRCTGKRLVPHNGHAECECACREGLSDVEAKEAVHPGRG